MWLQRICVGKVIDMEESCPAVATLGRKYPALMISENNTASYDRSYVYRLRISSSCRIIERKAKGDFSVPWLRISELQRATYGCCVVGAPNAGFSAAIEPCTAGPVDAATATAATSGNCCRKLAISSSPGLCVLVLESQKSS